MRNYNYSENQRTSQPQNEKNQSSNDPINNQQKAPNIGAEKIDFLTALMKEATAKNQNELMPFLMGVTQQANEKGVQFNDDETEMLVQLMTANMSPAERKKVELLRRMSKMMGKRKNSNETPPK